MCGIAGIFAYHYAANPVDRDELRRIREHMAARGPDGRGEWFSADGRMALGHRRLSIIDLSPTGAQPMATVDGALVISFNGEIYNYRALRQKLEAQGARFQSQSDTEVILHLYAQKGVEMLHDLRGMFAFALRDARKNALLLARDPYGIKPLYYADDGWTCRVASQVKALLAGSKVAHDPEPAGVVGFYLFGHVPEPYTLYQEIRAVPAGSYVWVNELGARAPRQYFSIAAVWANSSRNAIDRQFPADASQHRHSRGACPGPRSGGGDPPPPLAGQGRVGAANSNQDGEGKGEGDDVQKVIRSALLDSARHHLVADVPVGAFLSAGVDSGALVGLMRDAGQQDIQTVTVAFDEFAGSEEDEAPLAAQTARHYGVRHNIRRVTEREFHEDLPKILAAMDQPTIDGINTWFVAKATREQGLKVAISGLGGDELFGGYPSFKNIPRSVRLLAVPSLIPGAGHAFRHIASVAQKLLPGINPKTTGLLKYGGSYAGAYFLQRGLFMPWELKELLHPELLRRGLQRLQAMKLIRSALYPNSPTPFARVAALEASLYMRNQLLHDADWASMAHSVEVRLPLVDVTLLSRLASVFSGTAPVGKEWLAASPIHELPAEIRQRPKSGFLTPIAKWAESTSHDQASPMPHTIRTMNSHWSRMWAWKVAVANNL